MKAKAPGSDRLAALAAFAKTLETIDPADTEHLTKIAGAFDKMAYRTGWVIEGFGWPEWGGTAEAEALFANHGAIETATTQQLERLITTIVRGDRFNEGLLLENLQNGVMHAIARRAAALRGVKSLPDS